MERIGDEWETPKWLWQELNTEFKFDADLCANERNAKAPMLQSDVFTVDNHRKHQKLFMNPPYSAPYEFIEKAYALALRNVVVCLIKCDPSTKWWGIFYDYEKQQPKPGVQIRYFPKRIRFEYQGKPVKGSPTFPTAVVVMDRRLNGYT